MATIVAKSANKMPSLEKVAQTDAGERSFWKAQVGKKITFGIFKPDGNDVYYAVGAKIG